MNILKIRTMFNLANFTRSFFIFSAFYCFVVGNKLSAQQVSIQSFNAQTGNAATVHNLTNVPAGALLVLTTTCQYGSGLNATVSSSPVLTWTKQVDAASTGGAEVHTAVFTAGGSIAVTSNWGGYYQSSVCYIVINQEGTLGGASATGASQSTPSISITTTRNNSIIFCATSDWNSATGTITYRGSATQTHTANDPADAAFYHYHYSAATGGAYTVGMTSPNMDGGGSTAVLEIRSPVPDVTPPSAPTLSTSSTGSTSIGLTWTAATDNVAVTGYEVYVGGALNGTTTSTTYTVTGLTPSTQYSIYVKAKDAAGNGTNSNTITPTTAADTEAPSAPTLSTSSTGSTSIGLTWTAATDNVAVTGYEVYVGGALNGTTTSTTYTVTGLNPSTQYSIYVKAKDAAGNGTNSNIITPTTAADTEAPSAPTLSTSSTGSTSIGLTWTAATDNIGVTGYEVYVGGALNGTTANTTYTVTGLNPSTQYSIYVRAKDAAGNGTNSNTITPTTTAAAASSLRFGVSGEDTLATQNRLFDLNDKSFDIQNASYFKTQTVTENGFKSQVDITKPGAALGTVNTNGNAAYIKTQYDTPDTASFNLTSNEAGNMRSNIKGAYDRLKFSNSLGKYQFTTVPISDTASYSLDITADGHLVRKIKNNTVYLQFSDTLTTIATKSDIVNANAGIITVNIDTAKKSTYTGILGAGNISQSNFFGYNAGNGATSATGSNFFGDEAGSGAAGSYRSNFLGIRAGKNATNAFYSNFFGDWAGEGVTNAARSNFMGNSAGYLATNAYMSNFFGVGAGQNATNANKSNFFGNQAGLQATNSNNANFFGYLAGFKAANARNAIFIGESSGNEDGLTSPNTTNNGTSDYSVLLGRYTRTGGFKNSILLGGSISASTFINNTADNQFMLAPNINKLRFNSFDYDLATDTLATRAYVRSVSNGGGFFSPNQISTGSTTHTANHSFTIDGWGPKRWDVGTVASGEYSYLLTDFYRLQFSATSVSNNRSVQIGAAVDGFVALQGQGVGANWQIYGSLDSILLKHSAGDYRIHGVPDSVAGSNYMLVWDAATRRLHKASIPNGGGVTTIGTFGNTPAINGANIIGNSITFQPASTTRPGMIKVGSGLGITSDGTLSSQSRVRINSGNTSTQGPRLNLIEGAGIAIAVGGESGDIDVTISATSNGTIDSIYRTPGVDSIKYVKNGITYSIKDSVGGGSGYGLDSTKWAIDSINVYNKNIGNVGIGTITPTAKFHTLGSMRFESFKNNEQGDSVLTTDANGNLKLIYMPYGSSGGGDSTGGVSYTFENGVSQSNGHVRIGGSLMDSVRLNLNAQPFHFNSGSSRVFSFTPNGGFTSGNANYDLTANTSKFNIGSKQDSVGYGSQVFFNGTGNSDGLWMSRYNAANEASELRVNVGDDGGSVDKFNVGYLNGGTWKSNLVVQANGQAGIGTAALNGDLSLGTQHGDKLSIGNNAWANKTIIATGTDAQTGDYTELKVPGAQANSAYLRLNNEGSVGIGTIQTDAGYKLLVNGRIKAVGLRVKAAANWPDYVFDSVYQLRPLSEVEQFIKTNKHLPEIPKATEVEKNGHDVSETQIKLLQKIEELTLYIIEQEKRIKELEEKNKNLDDQNKQIVQMQQQLAELKKLILTGK